LMSRTPSAVRRSRSVSTPLAKAGLLLSPATSRTCQRLAATAPFVGPGTTASWACVDGGTASSGVQAPTNKARTTAAATRTNLNSCSYSSIPWQLGAGRAQRHLGVQPRHLLLAQPSAGTVPHRDVGALVEQRHRQRLEVAPAVDLRRIEHPALDT